MIKMNSEPNIFENTKIVWVSTYSNYTKNLIVFFE